MLTDYLQALIQEQLAVTKVTNISSLERMPPALKSVAGGILYQYHRITEHQSHQEFTRVQPPESQQDKFVT